MPCLIALIAFFFPRVALFVLFIGGHYLGRAFETNLWPLLGFFFMPFTTLAYALAMNENQHHLTGGWLVLFIVAVLADLGFFTAQGRRGTRYVYVQRSGPADGGRRQVRNEAE